MASEPLTVVDEVERYLRSGRSDPQLSVWAGGFSERATAAHRDLRDALVREVRRRVEGLRSEAEPPEDTVGLTRGRVESMVRGLFPRTEQDAVLSMLEKSVVFLTSRNIEAVVGGSGFDHSAWTLANLYLASRGAELLSGDAPRLVGLSEETTCYVSMEYFTEDDPFADFLVHEAAHVFHNCKRRTVGIPESRTREWLLPIEYRKRETFAYACEAYSCVVRRGKGARQRRELADEFAAHVNISEEQVDPEEVGAIVREASLSRNGWKVILSRCASPVTSRRSSRVVLC